MQAIVGGSGTLPLKVVIARYAWLDLGVGILKKIAEHLKVAVPKTASAWETMLVMTMKVLSLSEEEATGILAARVTKKKGDACVEELLQMDEASKLLSREDEDQFDKDKARQQRKAAEEDEVLREYKEARVRLRQAKADQAKAAGVRKGKKPQVRRLPDISVLDHSTAKTFAPPGAFLWRSFHNEAWCGRVPPRQPVSRGWRKAGGSNEALHSVLVILWRQYCEDEGLAESECPMKGVFTLDVAAGPASRSSGST